MIIDPRCIDRAKTRPPVLQATLTLGFTDSDVARIVGVSQMTVSEWATGKRPIPKLRYAALWFFITRAALHALQNAIESASPGSGERRRLEITQQIVNVWRDLAFDEIDIDDLELGLVTLGLLKRPEINALIGSVPDAERSEIRAALVAEIDRVKEQQR
jgi:hypothetical protein